MKIGIEGRLLKRNITGIERYIYNLTINVNNILNKKDNEIILYYDLNNKLKLNLPRNIQQRDIREIYNDVLNNKIDIYHRTFKPQSIEEIISFLGAKYLFTPHDLIAYKEIHKRTTQDFERYRKILELAIHGAEGIIAISKHNKRDIIENFNIPEDKIEVIYLGIDKKFHQIEDQDKLKKFKKRYSLPDNYLLYLGTDYPHKNLKCLLKAFELLIRKQSYKDLNLIIAGESYYGKKYLEHEIKKLDDKLIILNHFPEDELVYLYNCALAFIFPSLYEGFGLPPLEAMACGIPVVASNSTSIPETVGNAGLLVNTKNIEELAFAIEKVITDQNLRHDLIIKGISRAKKFNWELTAKKTIDYYKKIINNKSSLKNFKASISHLIFYIKQDFHNENKILNEKIQNLKNELRLIYNSKGWKLLQTLRNIKYKIFNSPPLILKKLITSLKNYGIKYTLTKIFNYLTNGKINFINNNKYKLWIKLNEPGIKELKKLQETINNFSYKPLISIIMPVFNVEKKWLEKAILSVQNQIYSNWELCIADDASTRMHIKETLIYWKNKDNRIKIKFLKENKGISIASNEALSLANGEFVGFLDHDDELAPVTLFEVVKLLNKHPDADIIYSDEDKINERGKRSDPYFKPDWSPELILSNMYTCHFSVYRKKIIDKIGGFREGFEGAQDYDLILRISELTNKIYHIPKILYHWRMLTGSTAYNPDSKRYAFKNGLKAIEDAIRRRKENAWVEDVKEYPGSYRIHYNIKRNDLISIIILTKDNAKILNNCLSSIFNKTTYQNYEIIIIDNGSQEDKTFKTFYYWQKKEKVKIETLKIDFNYSKLNNYGVDHSNGSILLFLNNDIEVISNNWLEEMLGFAQRHWIGAVGAKLLYLNNKIQHAGIILGIGGVAGHSHKYFHFESPGYYGRLINISNYSAVTGACLMVRRNIFQEVNGFDENLPIAFNDVDLCLKIRQKGYYNVVLPHVLLYHHESLSRGYENTPQKYNRFQKEINYMKNKWGQLLNNDPFYNPNLTLTKEDFSIKL